MHRVQTILQVPCSSTNSLEKMSTTRSSAGKSLNFVSRIELSRATFVCLWFGSGAFDHKARSTTCADWGGNYRRSKHKRTLQRKDQSTALTKSQPVAKLIATRSNSNGSFSREQHRALVEQDSVSSQSDRTKSTLGVGRSRAALSPGPLFGLGRNLVGGEPHSLSWHQVVQLQSLN